MRVAPFCMVLRQNEGVISVPTGRFVAAATLALRFRTEQSFLGASDEPLGATGCWSRRRYHRT